MPPVIWMNGTTYNLIGYDNEADLEKAIQEVKSKLFGPKRIYLDIKKGIGQRGGKGNVPDGYLIDLSGKVPRLYVVEVELAEHDLLRHIATQILEFSLSFESSPRSVRTIVFEAIHSDSSARNQCEQFAYENGFRNLDHLIDVLVHDSQFAALVIIDEVPDKLERVLAEKFKFGIEVLTLARYENENKQRLYHFDPFLSGVGTTTIADSNQIDTVIVPARKDGFDRTFIGENRWYAVRIHGTVRPQIKYIAAYQVRPISAITHWAPVKSIEPYGDEGKSIIHFSEPAIELERPIKLADGGKIKAPQNLRYTNFELLRHAKTLDEVFPSNCSEERS